MQNRQRRLKFIQKIRQGDTFVFNEPCPNGVEITVQAIGEVVATVKIQPVKEQTVDQQRENDKNTH